jgi:hypothetical protein
MPDTSDARRVPPARSSSLMSTTSTKSPTKKPKPSLSPEQAQSLDWLIERATLILRDEKGVYTRYDVLLLPQTMPYEGTLVGFDGLTFGRIKEVKGRYDAKRAEKKLARAASDHGRRDGELKALKEQTVKAVGKDTLLLALSGRVTRGVFQKQSSSSFNRSQ